MKSTSPMLKIVFTDLDGTLLDHQTYDYSPARPALAQLKEKNIPLVVCTSRTAAEVLPFRAEIENEDPFIVENGGGIYIPNSYFSTIPFETSQVDHFLVISLGRPCAELQEALARISDENGLVVESFLQMTASELAERSGLSLPQAARSLQREFDLPFRILSQHYSRKQLEEEVQRFGLRLTQGGRFFHLSEDGEKGEAVAQLLELYQLNHGGPVQSIGLGDSHNDLSMLREVHIPVIIPNPHSMAPLSDELPAAQRAHAPGPRGWNDVVLSFLVEERMGKEAKLT